MKKGIIFFSAAIALVLFASNSMVESDKTVKIVDQVWAVNNLDVTTYRNGDAIPEVKNPTEWAKLKTGAWCYYDNKEENGHVSGKLYNWYAVNDPRGLAPSGFHIPTDDEWKHLSANLDGEEVGSKIKTRKGWKENKAATNETGFSAVPGGYRTSVGSFIYKGNNACFWTATKFKDGFAMGRALTYNLVDLGSNDGSMNSGLSVRCMAD